MPVRQPLRLILIFILLINCFGCKKELRLNEPEENPVNIFDEVWNVMDQRYPMFSFKQSDWKKTYTEYRAQVSENTTPAELFRILSKMLETLKDGHVALLSPTDTAVYQNFYTSYPANFNYNNIVNNYLQNTYQQAGQLIYKIVNGIGYIYCGSFRPDITEANLDKMFTDLSITKGLIIDVRDNTGGNTANADRLFSRFLDNKKLVKYIVYKNGTGHNDLSLPFPVYANPSPSAYKKPVMLLTNRKCFSACNDFAMYMAGLDNVRLIGDQTGGGGGIPGNYLLKNGWKLQYSTTITLDPDNINVEHGIVPDINIPITPINETNGVDPIVEKAYEYLQ